MIIWLLDWNDGFVWLAIVQCNCFWSGVNDGDGGVDFDQSLLLQVVHRWANFLLCVEAEAKAKLTCKQFTMKWWFFCLLAVFLLLNNFRAFKSATKKCLWLCFLFDASPLFPCIAWKNAVGIFESVCLKWKIKNIKYEKKKNENRIPCIVLFARALLHQQFDFLF